MTARGTDWNDLHVAEGLETVRRQLAAALTAEPASPPGDAARELGESSIQREAVLAGEGAEAWTRGLDRTQTGAIKPTPGNIRRILTNDPRLADVLSYCEFTYDLVKRHPPPWPHSDLGPWEDHDMSQFRVWLDETYRVTASRENISDALITVARGRRFHPVREWLEELAWDGTQRCQHWLRDAFESPNSADYLAQVGVKFLVGSVARIMAPGCKHDAVLILEGLQGLKKSTSLQALFGADWFQDTPIKIGDKDAYLAMKGAWCIEIAELDSFQKAESTAAKAFFSSATDTYRAPYGVKPQKHKRQTVFAATTNQEEYLKDYTGNRRYWPVFCSVPGMEWIRANRAQLWAEALALYRQGTPWWVTDEEEHLFSAQQDQRLLGDPWEDTISMYLLGRERDFVASNELLHEVIGVKPDAVQKQHQARLSPIMQHLGWRPSRGRVDGVQVRGYRKEATDV